MRESEGDEAQLNQLAAFALVINIFLRLPVLFIEYTLDPLYLERGRYVVPFFMYTYVSAFSLEQRLIALVKLSSGSSSVFNYGS